MRLLTFQAERFAWTPFSKTLDDGDDAPEAGEVSEAVVAFLHIEKADGDDRRKSVFRQTLKHLKWLANKRGLRTVVLHSFTHLGGDTADADFARGFMSELQDRLQSTGYTVRLTAFGWFSSWDLAVYGESLAKVYKEI